MTFCSARPARFRRQPVVFGPAVNRISGPAWASPSRCSANLNRGPAYRAWPTVRPRRKRAWWCQGDKWGRVEEITGTFRGWLRSGRTVGLATAAHLWSIERSVFQNWRPADSSVARLGCFPQPRLHPPPPPYGTPRPGRRSGRGASASVQARRPNWDCRFFQPRVTDATNATRPAAACLCNRGPTVGPGLRPAMHGGLREGPWIGLHASARNIRRACRRCGLRTRRGTPGAPRPAGPLRARVVPAGAAHNCGRPRRGRLGTRVFSSAHPPAARHRAPDCKQQASASSSAPCGGVSFVKPACDQIQPFDLVTIRENSSSYKRPAPRAR